MRYGKKSLLIIAILFLNMLNVQLMGQIKYTINESWRFTKADDGLGIEEVISKMANSEVVDIPHTWNDKDVIDEQEGFYRGVGWYSKQVKIPTAYHNKQIFLLFEGVATAAEVYINQNLAATHIGSYTRFVVPVSKWLEFDASKEFLVFNLVVKADNSPNENWPPLTADFTFFGGIYRDVNLVVKDKVHFNFEEDASNGVFLNTPMVTQQRGDVSLKVRIKNDAQNTRKVQLVTKLYDPGNRLIQEKTKKITLESHLSNEMTVILDPVFQPQLWSIDSPKLYTVVSEIVDSNTQRKLDESINPLGFRWYEFDAQKGFFLNGEPLKLIGVNRHQDFKAIGNALPDHIHKEDVLRMKEMGCNFLRIAHYPQDVAILEMCDKLGILASVETPIVDVVTESEEFTNNCLSAQFEMIRQNYNHPSLIIWAYMNEVLLHPPFKNDPVRYDQYCAYLKNLAQQIEDLTRAEDPYRYTMIPNHNSVDKYKYAGLTEIPKIIGFNIYLGWYGGGFELLEKRLKEFREGVTQPIIITEYGAGVDPRLHTLNPMRFDFTHEYATQQHNYYLSAIQRSPYIAGATVWNYADFSSEHRVDAVQSINNKGLVSIDRKPKDVFYFYQASLLKDPFVALATKTWHQRSYIEDSIGSGISTIPVQVFSNQTAVELFHNGKSLGVQKMDSVITEFDVPFTDGQNTLRAIAINQKECEDVSTVRINVIPLSLIDFPACGLSINAGDQRFFYDDQIDQAWMIDKAYIKGSWGHIGGKPYIRPVKNMQQPYGAKQTIKGTANDPIYQTQLVGIENYHFDVPSGIYEITLHFAELEGAKVKHMPYDLTESAGVSKESGNRVFSVEINNRTILDKFDIVENYGVFKAVSIKSEVAVFNNETIRINFRKVVGEPIINGIEIHKKL